MYVDLFRCVVEIYPQSNYHQNVLAALTVTLGIVYQGNILSSIIFLHNIINCQRKHTHCHNDSLLYSSVHTQGKLPGKSVNQLPTYSIV